MKDLTAKEVRDAFIAYFESKGHTHVDSASLVPANDNTLLFTNAGMVQFKDVFLGVDKRDYKRAVTAQRCVRAGGKHNDLDTVGRTARHHTFFEMMGNFSFGDYFKRDAIAYAWEFLTEVLEMPADRLYATVYEEDDEAFELWHEVTGMEYSRIYRIGAKDNFWAMGDTGPCGPCSEIFFDRGEEYGCDGQPCAIGSCDCDRWMEIWNLVFMQFDRSAEGVLTPLPHPSIDTGLGLERVASILQHQDSNYDTDIMRGLIHGVEELSGQEYHGDQRGFPFRVIADHARSCSFLIADGVIPSNEGRGYVLRRILRRAARFGLVLGMSEPFLYRLFPYVKASLADAYPILIREENNIIAAIRMEEERFHLTLRSGMVIAQGMVNAMKDKGETQMSGRDLFTLYDTYGFPLDLAKDIAEENGFTVDEQGFQDCMDEQRRKSQSAQKEAGSEDIALFLGQLLSDIPLAKTLFYDQTAAQARVTALVIGQQPREDVTAGDQGWLTLDATPFYGESGGQIGDIGVLTWDQGLAEIIDSQKLHNGQIVHKFSILSGSLHPGSLVMAQVNNERRSATCRNHSATHLLHRALRMTLGDQVHQAGSLVTDQRLRFDYNYHQPLTKDQLRQVEDEVNRQIVADLPIATDIMGLEEAKASGAMAFFGDKYDSIVRRVSMGEFCRELCGGTHCASTGQLGSLKIVSDSGIGSGMRRIEALTGLAALAYYREEEERLHRAAALVKTTPDNLERRLEQLLAENKAWQRENEKLQAQLAGSSIEDLWKKALNQGGVNLLAAQVEAADMAALRNTADMLRDKLPDYALALAASEGDKVQFVIAISPAAQAKGLHAGKLIKEVAAVCGGSGGGRPDLAQAGAKDADPEKIAVALAKAEELILSALA